LERRRWLGQHRRQHGLLRHHRQGKIAREAHADGADARAAGFFMGEPRRRHQSLRDGARRVRSQRAAFGALKTRRPFIGAGHGAITAKQ
jgi:hypothetical protein